MRQKILPETGFKHSKCLLHNNPSSPVTPILPLFSSGTWFGNWCQQPSPERIPGISNNQTIYRPIFSVGNVNLDLTSLQCKCVWNNLLEVMAVYKNYIQSNCWVQSGLERLCFGEGDTLCKPFIDIFRYNFDIFFPIYIDLHVVWRYLMYLNVLYFF